MLLGTVGRGNNQHNTSDTSLAGRANFFANWPFSGFFPTNTPLTVSFQKMDPYLGAVIIGAELPCAGANTIGAYTSDVAVGWQ
jgi:hypothetical protein